MRRRRRAWSQKRRGPAIGLVLLGVALGCATAPPPRTQPAPGGAAESEASGSPAVSPSQAQVMRVLPNKLPPSRGKTVPLAPNPADVTRASALVKRGELLYRNGEYEEAERVLKESITIYPFMAQANLLLGKVFLIRGSATRDLSMMHSARLMFEMARALDSSLREAEILLDLFLTAPPE